MEFKTINRIVPKSAEVFTPDYEMIRIGREKRLNRKPETNTTTTDKIRELESQMEWMRRELIKYGILCESIQRRQYRQEENSSTV